MESSRSSYPSSALGEKDVIDTLKTPITHTPYSLSTPIEFKPIISSSTPFCSSSTPYQLPMPPCLPTPISMNRYPTIPTNSNYQTSSKHMPMTTPLSLNIPATPSITSPTRPLLMPIPYHGCSTPYSNLMPLPPYPQTMPSLVTPHQPTLNPSELWTQTFKKYLQMYSMSNGELLNQHMPETPIYPPVQCPIDDNLPQDLSMPKTVRSRDDELSINGGNESSGYASRGSVSPLVVVS